MWISELMILFSPGTQLDVIHVEQVSVASLVTATDTCSTRFFWWSGWGGSGLQARTTMVNPAVDVKSCSWLEVGLSTFPLNSWWRLLGYCWSCVILSILQSYTLFIFNKLVYLLHWWFNWESFILTHSIEVLWLGKINGIFTFIIRGIQYPGSWYYKFMLPWWT